MEPQPERLVDNRPITFQQLYKLLPLQTAIALSRQEREENGYSSTTLAYGEIEYTSFFQVN